jgi:hypothetical protein
VPQKSALPHRKLLQGCIVFQSRRRNAYPDRPLAAMVRKRHDSVKGSTPALNALTRLMVLTLAGLDSRSATPDEIMLWLGSAPGKTKACIELALSKGWVQRKKHGITLLKAGRQRLARPPPQHP